MATIKCFWLERTDREKRWLRRWQARPGEFCASAVPDHKYHQALTPIEDGELGKTPEGDGWLRNGELVDA